MKFNKKIIGLIAGAAVILFAGKFVYDEFINDDYTHSLMYISVEGNDKEKEQIDAINKTLKDNSCKSEEIHFNMLKVDDKNNMVIKESEYNKLAKESGLKEVNVKENETIIIPRYDGIKNTKYLKEQKSIKEFKINDKTLKVSGVGEEKIFVTGLFDNQLIVSDKVYDELCKNKDNKDVKVMAYDYKVKEDIKNAMTKFKPDSLFSNNNDSFYFISK